jgi:pimeloyl-ACP methyl ester carboxylesterase
VVLPRTRAVALSVVLLFGVAGCGVFDGDDGAFSSEPRSTPTPSPVAPSSSAPTAGTPPALGEYYGQQLDWKPCRKIAQCADLTVPLDYAEPSGRSIELALLKVPAADKGARLGSMVVNPGGPGGSGVDYAAAAEAVYGTSLRRTFDVVGFDPRGVARSEPVECVSDQRMNAMLDSDPDPDTAAERRQGDTLLRELGQGCLDNSGDVARHVSTVEVAKDLDVLRAVLGDDRLTYFGASYGTAIGSQYAELFPRRVGRMVLDGALDPTSSTLEVNLVQAHGFEVALRAYVGACVDRGGCFLGTTVDEGTRRIARFLADVERRPLPTSSGRDLTAGNAVYGVWQPLYDKKYWEILDTALQRAFRGDGSLLMTVADAYLHRNPDGTFQDNTFEAFYAISCLDHDDAVPGAETDRYLSRFQEASPTFGAIFAYSTTACDSWPIHSGRTPRPVNAKGAPPIMVVGTTRDPATPLVWARALAEQLHGVLVTRDGDGHTGYHQGSSCVDDAVESYLVSGVVPNGPVTC